MESASDRLRSAREKKGFTSASQAAKELGIGASTYRHHENGTRDYDSEQAKRYARFYGVEPEWLLYGKGSKIKTVPLVGYIGAGAEFHALDDNAHGDGMERITAPPNSPPSAVAVKVRGSSMFPVYNEGDILIYSGRRYDVNEFIGKRCVCGLSDGRVLVKTITRGSQSGLYSLASFNSPPIDDVLIDWASKILWVQPR